MLSRHQRYSFHRKTLWRRTYSPIVLYSPLFNPPNFPDLHLTHKWQGRDAFFRIPHWTGARPPHLHSHPRVLLVSYPVWRIAPLALFPTLLKKRLSCVQSSSHRKDINFLRSWICELLADCSKVCEKSHRGVWERIQALWSRNHQKIIPGDTTSCIRAVCDSRN